MKYNVTDYNRAKNLLEVLEKDVMEYGKNYIFILNIKKDILSNAVSKKFITFFSSAAFRISTGICKPITNIDDVDVFAIFKDTRPNDFISLRAFDFETYDDIIEGHLDPLIDSKGASEFFKQYKPQLKDVVAK